MINIGYYKRATICLNGHVLSYSGESHDQFCSSCGETTISVCPNCNTPIRGKYELEHVLDLTGYYDKPKYCYSCGKPFPWTKSAIEALREIILEDDRLTESDSTHLTDSLSDVISETPRTSLAAARIQRALKSAGKFTADALRQFAIDFGCEMIKQQLNL